MIKRYLLLLIIIFFQCLNTEAIVIFKYAKPASKYKVYFDLFVSALDTCGNKVHFDPTDSKKEKDLNIEDYIAEIKLNEIQGSSYIEFFITFRKKDNFDIVYELVKKAPSIEVGNSSPWVAWFKEVASEIITLENTGRFSKTYVRFVTSGSAIEGSADFIGKMEAAIRDSKIRLKANRFYFVDFTDIEFKRFTYSNFFSIAKIKKIPGFISVKFRVGLCELQEADEQIFNIKEPKEIYSLFQNSLKPRFFKIIN